LSNLTFVFYGIITIMLCFSFMFIKQCFLMKKETVRFKRNRYKEFTDFVKIKMLKTENDELFLNTGIKLSSFHYNTLRFLVFIVFLLYLGFNETDFVITMLIIIAIYIVTTPKKQVAGINTPFHYVIEYLRKDYRRKIDFEIYNAVTQLKNVSISNIEKPLGSDFIIQTIMKFTSTTKPIFSRFLNLYRLGKIEDAHKYFVEATGTKLGEQFADILVKIDKINPAELKSQLELYQHNVSQERATDMQRKYEKYSNIIFIPSIALALLIILNFVIIVVYIDLFKNINF